MRSAASIKARETSFFRVSTEIAFDMALGTQARSSGDMQADQMPPCRGSSWPLPGLPIPSPDTEIAWRDVLPGALATALLFNVGRFAIGWYIGTEGPESAYCAAASIVILLIFYYSAQIVLFGAEVTHAYAVDSGSRRTQSIDASTPHKANS
jgi:hypothetical protein